MYKVIILFLALSVTSVSATNTCNCTTTLKRGLYWSAHDHLIQTINHVQNEPNVTWKQCFTIHFNLMNAKTAFDPPASIRLLQLAHATCLFKLLPEITPALLPLYRREVHFHLRELYHYYAADEAMDEERTILHMQQSVLDDTLI